ARAHASPDRPRRSAGCRRTRRADRGAAAPPPGAPWRPGAPQPPRSPRWCADRRPGPHWRGPGPRRWGRRRQGPRRGCPAPLAPDRLRRWRAEPALVPRHRLASEDQGLSGDDHRRGPPVPVAERSGDVEAAAAAHLHALDALVPAGDDLADAELEAQRLAAVPGGIELLAGGVGDPDVVDVDDVSAAGLLTIADDLVGAEQLGRGGALRTVDLWLAALGHAIPPVVG